MKIDLPDGAVVADVLGQPHKQTTGRMTNMALSEGESWKVACDSRRGPEFEEWLASQPQPTQAMALQPGVMAMLERCWSAARDCHVATLRRVGWLDQKGRVWTQVPATADFDGGSLSPLIIDPGER